MPGLAYKSVLALGENTNLKGKDFTLRLGPWALDSVPFSTLATLADDPALLHEILGRCFVNRPVLWSDLAEENARHCVRALEDLSSLLTEHDQRLAVAPHSRDLVFREIVNRWQEATSGAIEQLAAVMQGPAGDERDQASRVVLCEYRCKVYGPISALVQFLSEDDDWTAEVRERLAEGTSRLVDSEELVPGTLQEALWYVAPGGEDVGDVPERELVTWGIP